MRALGLGLGFVFLAGLTIGALHVTGLSSSTALASPRTSPPPPTPAGATPVLVELFTSEGCSSCPPADETLAKLSSTQPVPGAYVVALAHHVDYWNQLGWPDPFSSAEATSRQRGYGGLGSGSYTPQAVVDGQSETVGSRGAMLELLVRKAAAAPHARVDLEVTRSSGAVEVTVRSGPLPADAGDDAEVSMAIVQDGGRVVVPRGENAGRTLDHVAIARALRVLGPMSKTGGVLRAEKVMVPSLTNAPSGSTFSIVAFVAERRSHRVLGSARAPMP